jgi:hypothetical protein
MPEISVESRPPPAGNPTATALSTRPSALAYRRSARCGRGGGKAPFPVIRVRPSDRQTELNRLSEIQSPPQDLGPPRTPQIPPAAAAGCCLGENRPCR